MGAPLLEQVMAVLKGGDWGLDRYLEAPAPTRGHHPGYSKRRRARNKAAAASRRINRNR